MVAVKSEATDAICAATVAISLSTDAIAGMTCGIYATIDERPRERLARMML